MGKLLDMLFSRRRTADAPAAETTPERSRTPEEAKARRDAYRRRKAAKAARRRNRK